MRRDIMMSRRALGMALAVVMAMVLILAFGTWNKAYADDSKDTYKYKVMIYSGEQGKFDSGKVWTKEYEPGETCEVDLDSLGFKLTNDKYYVRGFRITGHDNDETTGFQNLNFTVDQDVSYEIAYGIAGGLVKYVVNYEDANGKTLRKSDTYYGMAGDKPVVAYRYVDGYQPRNYNLGKRLVKDEGENVFTFIYDVIPSGSGSGDNGNGGTGTGNGGNGAGGGAAAPAAPGTAANPAGTNAAGAVGGGTAPGPVVNGGGDGNGAGNGGETVDGNDVPLTDPNQQYHDIDGNDTPSSENPGFNPFIGLGAGIIIILILLAIYLLKKRGSKAEMAAAEGLEQALEKEVGAEKAQELSQKVEDELKKPGDDL